MFSEWKWQGKAQNHTCFFINSSYTWLREIFDMSLQESTKELTKTATGRKVRVGLPSVARYELIGDFSAQPLWNGLVGNCRDTFSKEGRQNRPWSDWPHRLHPSVAASSHSPHHSQGWMRSGLDQRGDTAKTIKAICVIWLTCPFYSTEQLHREVCKHSVGTGNSNNYAGVEIGLNTRSVNACSETIWASIHTL